MNLSRRSLFVLPVLPAVLSACQGGPRVLEVSGPTMGTTFNVVAIDPDARVARADLVAAINGALDEVNTHLSNWDTVSEVSRFNRTASTMPITVSPALSDVLAAADEVHRASAGKFDITIGPLIELWGFGAERMTTAMPEQTAIDTVLAQSGQGGLRLDAGTVTKAHPETQVFLSAIGKGYGVDRVARAVADLGLSDFLVEIGGDLYASGHNAQGRDWQIGIEVPDASARRVQSVASVSGLGMATSGDYRNFFEVGGQRYSHILDPQTGRPITHRTASATVLTDDAMRADAWATAMLILGRDRGLEVAEAEDLAVVFVEPSDTGFVTTASPRFTALQG